MAAIKMYKIVSASILETMVAMVVLLIVFGITTMVFVQATTSSLSFRKMEAVGLLNRYISDTEKSKTYDDEEFKEDEWRIIKQVEKQEAENLVKVSFSIFDGNKEMYKVNRLFILNEQKW